MVKILLRTKSKRLFHLHNIGRTCSISVCHDC